MSEFDAIVVGAGVNGLAAGVHLSQRGWRVLVLEKASAPGGAVRTEEITLPGFRHDLYAMNLSMFAGSAFYAEHKTALDAQGLAFVPVANSFASPFPIGNWLGVSTDLDKTTARIEDLSPADAATWRRMAQDFATEAPFVGGIMGQPMPSFGAVKLLIKAWRKKGLPWVRDMVRLLLASPRNYLDPRFESPEVRALMAAWGLHLDFGPDVAGGAVFPYLESMANQNFGMVIGQGGADTIIKAMVGVIEASNGEVRPNAEVAQILQSGGRATGVRLLDGTEIAAKRAVIANTHPSILARTLVPGIDKSFAAAAGKFRPGPGAMMIHLAMDGLPDWSASPELKTFAYVHLAPSYDVMSAVYHEAMSGLLPREPVLVVGQPTAIDPSRAPDGKHVLWVQVRVVPYEIKGDASGSIAARHWDEAKQPYADRVLDLIERYAPGMRNKIIASAVLSPLDLERANPNLVRGDSLSGSHHLDQNFLFRPAGGWSRYRTPVKDLYMVGASTWPGAGTGVGSGYMLAKMLAR
ncbi:phytoene desaturase family protein [Devosia rhizoryzae]|uniref:Pyridine nucleotide-disulfide oxidoreductase domain-containing protein 2 n=1 Tax=Devosia rhizoryzae TaxID=2774137 RepID=A0ABX7CDA2_9HYPH|nr:NAD(P)/FAD-dependent oxidoreductase [Devosia rhizoryzae]QQR40767.1 NAD(P)/FAD-dependent oxidoreductase [Devosia rhizoryzae]